MKWNPLRKNSLKRKNKGRNINGDFYFCVARGRHSKLGVLAVRIENKNLCIRHIRNSPSRIISRTTPINCTNHFGAI